MRSLFEFSRKSFHRILIEDYLMLSTNKLRGKILDIGSGSRRYDGLLAGEVTAIDIKPNASKNIIFGNAEQPLNFQNDTFDAVVCVEVMQYVAHWQQLLNEIHRILKPGGRAIITLAFMYHECGDKVRLTAPYIHEELAAIFDEVEQKKIGNAYIVIWDIIRKQVLRLPGILRPILLILVLPYLLLLLALHIGRYEDLYYSGLCFSVTKSK